MSPTRRPWLVGAALIALLLTGGALRLHSTRHGLRHLSADERAYVRLAQDLSRNGSYGDPGLRQPRHWAPGAPAMFALAGGAGDALTRRGGGVGSPAATAQVVVSTLTIAAVFALAWLLAGTAAALPAAAFAAFYPPAISMAGSFLSEPLGGLALTAAAAALVWAWRARAASFALVGVLFGLACLVRADLLLPSVAVAVAVTWGAWRSCGRRSALLRGGLLAAGVLVAIAPWSVASSVRLRQVVPVTSGGSATLYIGTYLPGHGTVFGFKQALRGEVCRRTPEACTAHGGHYRAQQAVEAVAERRPTLTHEQSLQAADIENLRRYALGQPVAFGRMLAAKTWRLWGGVFRGTDQPVRRATLWLHRGIVLGALLGLMAGTLVGRDRRLATLVVLLACATAVNVVFVAEARHNVRLLPVLMATGAAGWCQVLRARSGPMVFGDVTRGILDHVIRRNIASWRRPPRIKSQEH